PSTVSMTDGSATTLVPRSRSSAYPAGAAGSRTVLRSALPVYRHAQRRLDREAEIEPVLVSDDLRRLRVSRLRIVDALLALDDDDPVAGSLLQRQQLLAERLQQLLLRLTLHVALGCGRQLVRLDLLVCGEEVVGALGPLVVPLKADLVHRPCIEIRPHALHAGAVAPHNHCRILILFM